MLLIRFLLPLLQRGETQYCLQILRKTSPHGVTLVNLVEFGFGETVRVINFHNRDFDPS